MENQNLEENFKLFYRIAKALILELNDEDRVLAAQWLRKLASCQSPEDSERRNHYMTLLLITLQQKRIVGPFKKTPDAGNNLEQLPNELQANDIQKLLEEDLAKTPLPPLAQFGLAGGKLSTEFAVTQEIPKFGAHFYYVYTLEPIYDFQRAYQSRIPPPMRGPSQSTMRDLNAGVEHLLRSEKKKLKVTVDQLGRKQIKIRDEHFAEFSGAGRPRQIPKRLQKRLGFKPPEPELQEVEAPLTSFVPEASPPRRTPQPSTSTATFEASVETTVAAAVGAAVAAAAGTPRRTSGIPKPSRSIPKRPHTIARPSGGIPKYTGTIPKPSRGIPPPQAAPRVATPVVEVQPPSPVRAPPAAVRTPPASVRTPPAHVRSPPAPVRRSPIKFTPHPFAPPTPPLFAAGGSTQGLSYQPEDFELDPSTKFNYPHERILASKWTPSKRGERIQVLDIIRQHPITEETLLVAPDEPRRHLLTPEIEHEVQETMRRSNMLFQTEDTRTRELMRKYYESKPVRPKTLDFTPEEEFGEPESASFQPFLLDSSPVIDRQQVQYHTPPSVPRAGTPLTATPPMPRSRSATPRRTPPLGVTTPRTPSSRPATPRSTTPRTPAPRAPTPVPRRIPSISEWFVDDEGLLDDEEIQLRDELIYIPSPARAPTPSPRHTQDSQYSDADEFLLEDEEIEFADDMPSPQWGSPVMTPVRTPRQTVSPRYSPDISPGGTTARLLDVGGDIPLMSPKSPRTAATMMDDIMLTTPEKMTKMANIISQIDQQVVEHKRVIQSIDEMPRSPSMDNLRSECTRGSDTLRTINSRLKSIRESARTSQRTPVALPEPEVIPEEPVPFSPVGLALEFQDLSDVINKTVEDAQIIQQIAESVQEQVVQEAADRSIDTVGALQEISDQVQDAAKEWGQRVVDLNTSSLGLIDEGEMDEDLLASPARETVNIMSDALDQSVREMIAEGGDPRSPAAQNLQVSLRNFKDALNNLSLESPSFLDESFPPDVLLDQTIDDLETSINLEAAALSSVVKTSENEAILNRAEAIVEAMNDVLDEVQTIEAIEPPEMLDDYIEPATPRRADMGYDDIVGEDEFLTTPMPKSAEVVEEMKQEMLGLLERAQQQQQALLEASLEIVENSADPAAVMASQEVSQSIQHAQEVVTDMISRVARTPPILEEEKNFGWLGPMAIQPVSRPPISGRRQPLAKSTPRPAPSRKPVARTAAARPVAARATATRQAPSRASAAATARSSAVRRPARGASPEALALPSGVQAPRPRAGSATPVPVRRPPRPVPLPGSTQLPAQTSSSIRTMIPRPGSSTGER